MKIWAKLALLTSTLIVTILGLTGLLQTIFERRTLLSEQRHKQEDTVRHLARVCSDAILEDNDLPMLNYVKTMLAAESAILEVVLVDLKGKVLFHSETLKGNTSILVDTVLKDERTLSGLAADRLIAQDVDAAGRHIRHYAAPVVGSAGKAAALLVSYDQSAAESSLHDILTASRRRFSMVAAAGILLGILGAFALAAHFTRPIRALVKGARVIGGGDLTHQMPADERKDELGELSREFNAMGTRLAELDALKQTFLESVTHDLRSPLTSIIGYVDVILLELSGPITEKQKNQLETMKKSGFQLAALINNILDLSKLEAGRMDFENKPGELEETARLVYDVMIVQADKYKIKLDISVDKGVGKAFYDPEQIQRVMTNLVTNSLKFTPAGGTVTLRVGRGEAGKALVTVSDTGVGIPKDKVGSMFKKFFQVQETKANARRPGTGLGLTICKQIVEAQGGTIWVESVWQKGSDFKFTLPLAEAESTPSAQSPVAAPV